MYLKILAVVFCYGAVWFAAQCLSFLQFRMRLANGLSTALFENTAGLGCRLGGMAGLLLITVGFTVTGFYLTLQVDDGFRYFLLILSAFVLVLTFGMGAYFSLCKEKVLASWRESDARPVPPVVARKEVVQDFGEKVFISVFIFFPGFCLTGALAMAGYFGIESMLQMHVPILMYLGGLLGAATGGYLTYLVYLRNA